jgi:glycosyltransferase involved in cell wall biosynthesis
MHGADHPESSSRHEPGARTRVLIVASHPIQYQVPWFRALAGRAEIDLSVLFIQQPDANRQGRGFGVPFRWDIPLLEGYKWTLAPNVKGKQDLGGFLSARLSHPGGILKFHEPEVVLLTGWHILPMLQLLMSARRAGIPIIMRGESNALRSRSFTARAGHRLLLGKCTAFLPVGRSSREFYLGYGIEESRLFDAPYFVDNERFITSAAQVVPARARLRDRWAIPADAVCFCYAGKLEPKKRIMDILTALEDARARTSTNLHLLVVGAGEQLAAARERVSAASLPVTFAGFLNQTEIPAAYVASDCLVLASDFGETWGLVVNEAMACGLPAIVSDRAGCGPDLIQEGITGRTYPFGDTSALADRLLEMTDLAAAKAMGKAAQSHVHRHYSVDVAVRATVEAVEYASRHPR